MQAVKLKSFGGSEQLYIGDYPKPVPGPKQLLIEVHATALNRADILQRKGKYPPPEGASEILGLEVAGTVVDVGRNIDRTKIGQKIFGLLPGGGYAQYATIHEEMALPIPPNLTFEDAAAIPEAFLTAYQGLRWLGKLKKKEKVLIHAGGSGVGTAAIQIARNFEAEIFITASEGKHDICHKLGAKYTIDYQKKSFETIIKDKTDKTGVDLIIDFIGAPYFEANINSLGLDGRLVIFAFMGGAKKDKFNLTKILMKRLEIHGSTLRSRNIEYQIALTQDFAAFATNKFTNTNLIPVIDSVFNWKEVKKAHDYMEANKNTGKIILKVR